MQGEHGATPLHYASRYRRNNPKNITEASCESPVMSPLLSSRRKDLRLKTLRSLVGYGVRKKNAMPVGERRGAKPLWGAKRRSDDSSKGSKQGKRKGKRSDRRHLIQRILKPFQSNGKADAERIEDISSDPPSSALNGDEVENGFELSERKSLLEVDGVIVDEKFEASSSVPHIVKQKATPERQLSIKDDYDAYFLDSLDERRGDDDAISVSRSDLGENRRRSRGLTFVVPENKFLDIGLTMRAPVKSASMPDIKTVDNEKNDRVNMAEDEKTGAEELVLDETGKKDKSNVTRNNTFSSPSTIRISGIRNDFGDNVPGLEGVMSEGRSLDTLIWKRVGKAMKSYEESIILYLLKNGAIINATDYYGATPLHYAAQRGNVVAVNELMSKSEIDIEVRVVKRYF